MISVRAVRRWTLTRLVAQALVLALQITLVPAELFARPARPEKAREEARREEALRRLAEDPAARPHPQASRPLALAPVRPPVDPMLSAHAWLVGRVALASLRSLLLRLIAPQTGGGGGSAQVTRQHTYPAGWSLVAVPLQPANPSAAAVFDELPLPLRLYDTVSGQSVSPDEPGFRAVAPGRAFWALLPSPVEVSATGTLVSTATPQAIGLVAGWNAISTPWLTAIPWTDGRVSVRRGSETVALTEAVARGWIDGNLGVHDPATDTFAVVPPNATPAGELRPWQGAVVFAQVPVDLVFSVPPPDTTPPVVSFTAPAESAVVAAITAVTGTADDPNLLEWRLEMSAGSGTPFALLARSDNPVAAGTLYELDPTTLENGVAMLRLSAIDAAGNTASVERTVIIEGHNKLGAFRISFKDLEVPVSGIPITVNRVYDTRTRFASRDFGFGWTVEIEGRGRYANNRKPGDGWAFTPGPLGLPCIGTVTPLKSHVTEIRFSDLEVYRFALQVTSPAPTLGGCFGTASFRPISGGIPGATLAILGNTEVFWPAGSGTLVELDTQEVYEPTDVRLTTRGGRVFDVNLRDGLERVSDANGNALQITPGGVLHSSGRSVAFARDSFGRITSITDPMGRALLYRYDTAGNLEGVKDRTGNEVTFEYDTDHFLGRVIDPTGNAPVRQEFDEAGRIVALVDAAGNRTEVASDPAANTSVATDRLGSQTTQQYDENGNLTGTTLTGGVTESTTYDSRNNPLTETDALGKTTTRTFDANNNVLTKTDPLGNRFTYTYDSGNRVLTTTDPRGKVTTKVYDTRGNLTSEKDALGNETTYTYDTRGNRLTQRDALGCETRYEYDTFGNLTKQTDAAGGVTTYTYDLNGNQATQTQTRTLAGGGTETLVTTFGYDAEGRENQVTDADGTIRRIEYDVMGREAATVDKLGRRTEFEYNNLGQHVKTTYADGTFEEFTFDAEGRGETGRDRAGRVTTYTYDPLDRLLQKAFADGTSTSKTYDLLGRVLSATDERGKTVRYEYDDAGRRTKVTDETGQVSRFGYDASGNQTSFTDPRGKVTTYEFDDVNRMIKTIHSDATTELVTYDAAGRKLTQTDQADKTTRFAYDCVGRLVSVTDALSQVTSYAYDEVGNQVSQTDANANVTRFEHDALGRPARRTLPLGASETFTYDAAGNPATRVDFSGATITYAHDANDRLTQRSHAGGSVTFTYTPSGKRATAVDAGGTVQYGYDPRDRLTSLVYPDGRRLAYGYDAGGNRSTLTATLGAATLATSYTYDDASRLATVRDPQGRTYTHGYDANGNRATLAYPNGVTTTYTYNDLNRLTALNTAGSAGVVQSYGFTLGPTGARTRIDEADGTSRAYVYDDLYRLTRETITGGAAAPYDTTYGYDPVGNRLTRQTTLAGAPPVTAYTYDERDRLLSADGASYTWDANGNLIARSGASGATYTWDLDGRLRRVTKMDGSVVEHAYDADGNRLQTRVTPPTGPPTVANFLVDTAERLSHVVAETDALGGLAAYHVRGDDLLATIRGTGTRFFHADGLGSVRRLTDETGSVTDSYTFTAFGELLEHTGSDPNAYLFAGEPLDPNSGFYYNRARWLDVAAGRFVSMDPAAGSPFDPVTLHRYLYAAADPVNKVDPTGEFFSMMIGGVMNLMTRLGTMAIALGGSFAIFLQRVLVHAAAFMRNVRLEGILGYDRYLRMLQTAMQRYPRIPPITQMHHVIPQYIVRHLQSAGINLPRFLTEWTVPLNARYHQLITNAIRAEYPFGAANVFSRNGDSVINLFTVLLKVYTRLPLGP